VSGRGSRKIKQELTVRVCVPYCKKHAEKAIDITTRSRIDEEEGRGKRSHLIGSPQAARLDQVKPIGDLSRVPEHFSSRDVDGLEVHPDLDEEIVAVVGVACKGLDEGREAWGKGETEG
jgi:hypothetical protein